MGEQSLSRKGISLTFFKKGTYQGSETAGNDPGNIKPRKTLKASLNFLIYLSLKHEKDLVKTVVFNTFKQIFCNSSRCLFNFLSNPL